jgi:crossover junction endodeoxyribonuclease RusA
MTNLTKTDTKQAQSEIKLTLPYPPSVNNLYFNRWGKRVLSDAGRRFKSDAGLLAILQGAKILTGDLSVTFRVFRPRKTGDLDNFLKVSQDSLKGICFADDKQIIEIHAFRFDDKANPRIEIFLKELERK